MQPVTLSLSTSHAALDGFDSALRCGKVFEIKDSKLIVFMKCGDDG
jgi:hypothetical protein